MDRRKFTKIISLSSTTAVIVVGMPGVWANVAKQCISDQGFQTQDLLDGFNNPSESARPWTYWMWLDGNVSKEGITSDLEALKKIGIGGVLIMNLGLPSHEAIQPGTVRFMTPQWRDLISHAVSEANRLGLQLTMNNDDGWNSGGPWITPKYAMQRLTWSETPVTGPAKFSEQLPMGATKLGSYNDVALLAIPVSNLYDVSDPVEQTVNSTSGRWIQHDYVKAVSIRSVEVTHPQMKPGYIGPKSCIMSVSDDGIHFREVRKFETGWLSFTAPRNITVSLGEITARFFRLTLVDSMIEPKDIHFKLLSETLIDHWHMKAGFSYIREHGGGAPLYEIPAEISVSGKGSFPGKDNVINLSEWMDADGRLNWDVPEGKWLILRIGHTPTGQKNGYATPEGRGLDSDKYNPKALEVHLSGMVDKVMSDSKLYVGKSLSAIHTDSWESGAANWTADFPKEFKKRRGYDLISWLPVMTGGRVISSIEESERFLWDIRRTIADIFIDLHLKYFRELAHKRGVLFSSESAGRQQFLYDPISFQVCSDLPLGEFWNTPQEKRPRPDCKAAASASHIAGLPIAGAEAFTQNKNNGGAWLESPYFLKALGDSAFCSGINRFYFHRTIAQPEPSKKPGMTWPRVGINFDTTQTWWKPGKAWIDYLTRCQYLLQQGEFVADVAILTDEGAPSSLTRTYHEKICANDEYDTSTVTESTLRYFNRMHYIPPFGYDYDFVNADAVHSMDVIDGKLHLPSGMKYQILVLPPSERMTLSLAQKLIKLVNAGATIVGKKPIKSPTLKDFPQGDKELLIIVNKLWGDDDSGEVERKIGKGKVFKGDSVKEALDALNVVPDFECSAVAKQAETHPNIDFIHRRSNSDDIYFISNQQNEKIELDCLFRVSGKQPECWFPDTGKVIAPVVFEKVKERTALTIRLDPSGSVFFVFRQNKAGINKASLKKCFFDTEIIKTIEGPWKVYFDPKWGGPAIHKMEKLHCWTKSNHDGIKYYSGTATYRKQFNISQKFLKQNKSLYIDLGRVKELARLKLNGEDIGVLWKPPFLSEITHAIKEGENFIEIEVTNLWPNRLIGDAKVPENNKVASVNWNPYKDDSPLLESGLIGPVTLQIGI